MMLGTIIENAWWAHHATHLLLCVYGCARQLTRCMSVLVDMTQNHRHPFIGDGGWLDPSALSWVEAQLFELAHT